MALNFLRSGHTLLCAVWPFTQSLLQPIIIKKDVMMLYSKTFLLLLTSLIPVSIFYLTGLVDIRIASLQILPLMPLAALIVRMVSYHILKKDTLLFTSYKKWLTLFGTFLVILSFTVMTLWQIESTTIWSISLGIPLALFFIFDALLRTELVISTHWIFIQGELVSRSEVHAEIHDDVLKVEGERIKFKAKIQSHRDEIEKVLETGEEGKMAE